MCETFVAAVAALTELQSSQKKDWTMMPILQVRNLSVYGLMVSSLHWVNRME